MDKVDARQALDAAKHNAEGKWNRGGKSDVRSSAARDAANRIFDDYADVRPNYSGPLHDANAGVFAMGSCFAREIEHALIRRGGKVISLDDSFRVAAFEGPSGYSTGFFHRYTPTAMVQEFRRAFDLLPGWSEHRSLVHVAGDRMLDLNFPDVGALATLDAIVERRRISAALVRKVVDADIIILTLGLTEGWEERMTGFAVNALPGVAMAARRDDFLLHQIGFDDCIAALKDMVGLIRDHHRTGQFRLIVTVSPVPLTATFTQDDIIVANMRSKSTLRAAAAEFVAGCDEADYFPSYELVTYTDIELAWRPDRIHVNPLMVRHIMSRFVDTVYRPGAFGDLKSAG